MKNKNGNYTLYCGDKSYEVTPEVRRTLEAVMYWEHYLTLDIAELQVAKESVKEHEENGTYSAYTADDVKQLQYEIEQENLTVHDIMNIMEKQKVPNWVGNDAMAFGRTHDLRETYASQFFEAYDFVHDTVSEDDELRLVNVDMHHDIVNDNEELNNIMQSRATKKISKAER